MAGVLTDFLRDSISHAFIYGQSDCCMWLANWVCWLHGTDPARELRGTYFDEAGWRRIVEPIGLAQLVADLARRAGIPRVDGKPEVGDIAVVSVPRLKMDEAGAIYGPRGFLMKLQARSVARLPCAPLMIWRP